jgi:hypothetical protein
MSDILYVYALTFVTCLFYLYGYVANGEIHLDGP